MKKLLAIWMALMLLPIFAIGETAAEGTPDTKESSEIVQAKGDITNADMLPRNLNYDYDELVVGTPMPMHGQFSFSMWGNAGSDVDVRKLIHGYNLVEWDNDIGGFEFDPNVVSGQLVESDEGDHIYNLYLCDDLQYSDGTPITAYDYAFSMLLRMSPIIAELGGVPDALNYLEGYDDYIDGTRETLAGIRVNGPYQLTIRISDEYLPFFYEVGMLNCNPCPIGLIAPGCEVIDSEDGVYLSQPLNAETLRETLLNPETGYQSHPSVTSGAYRLVSFDGEEARFELNERYKGDSKGIKPTIRRIVFRKADQETMMDDLASAKFGLLNKVTRKNAIESGYALNTETMRYGFTNYPRAGVSFIAFNTAKPALEETAVRRAIALCLDKESLTRDYAGDYGLAVNGFYGIGQWMFRMVSGALTQEPPEGATEAEAERLREDWSQLNLDGVEPYAFNPEAAAKLLDENGWELNANGVREKEIDGETMSLELKLCYSTATPIGDILRTRFAEPLKQAGIELTIEACDNLLSKYYGQEERDYDMAFLATNFDVLYDPSPLFEPGGASNYTGISDPELYSQAEDMKKTEQGDLLTYCRKWIRFLTRFAETEPMIPVYSNIYYDFYPDVLQNYMISENITWSQAIVPAFLSDPPEKVEDEAAEEETVEEETAENPEEAGT